MIRRTFALALKANILHGFDHGTERPILLKPGTDGNLYDIVGTLRRGARVVDSRDTGDAPRLLVTLGAKYREGGAFDGDATARAMHLVAWKGSVWNLTADRDFPEAAAKAEWSFTMAPTGAPYTAPVSNVFPYEFSFELG